MRRRPGDWNWQSSLYSYLLLNHACAWPLVRLLRSQPVRLTTRLSLVRFTGAEFTIQALLACTFCVAAIAIYQAPQTQESGFAIIALMLLSVALFTPYIIWKVFESFSYSLRWVKVRWFFADAAASMSYRGVATMAFMLAMAANIGVETMVGSFRDTTDKWLSQRLAADLYIYPNTSSAARMSGWLNKQPEVESVWWRWEKEVATSYGALQVVSTGPSEGELAALTVKLGIPNYWYHLHHSKGVMVSESMALKLGIRPGDYIELDSKLGQGCWVASTMTMVTRIILYCPIETGSLGSNMVALQLHPLVSSAPGGIQLVRAVFDNSDIHKQTLQVFAEPNMLGYRVFIIFATVAGKRAKLPL